MRDTSTLEISLPALDANMATIRRLVGPDCALCPIVKANAYGLGAPQIARRLAQAGADMLAVYSPEQAASALRAAPGVPVLVLMPVRDIRRTDEVARMLIAGQIHLTVHDEMHLAELIALGERFGSVLPLHLEIDTGLGRGGARPDEAIRLLEQIRASRWARLAGVMSHFASAVDDENASEQMAEFDAVLRAAGIDGDEPTVGALPERHADGLIVHIASSAAMLRHQRFHRRMVRFGLAWAGYGLDELAPDDRLPDADALLPALTWSSQLVQLKRVPAGATVGYGSTWRATRPSLLGLIPVGYADGYPRSTAGGAQVAIVSASADAGAAPRRRFVPVVGAVNMDQISVDLTDLLAEPLRSGHSLGEIELPRDLRIGTRVELLSADRSAPNHLPRVAAAAGTIPHELLARLHPGIRRVHRCEPIAAASSPNESPANDAYQTTCAASGWADSSSERDPTDPQSA